MSKRIFISADHGMAIIYFLQTDVIPSLLTAGHEVILLTDEAIKIKLATRNISSRSETERTQHGITIEGLRLKEADQYAATVSPRWQWLLAYLRRVGGSRRINTQAMDSPIWEVWAENSWKFRLGIWLPVALATQVLRNSAAARKALVRAQTRFTPNLYTDLFEKYQ